MAEPIEPMVDTTPVETKLTGRRRGSAVFLFFNGSFVLRAQGCPKRNSRPEIQIWTMTRKRPRSAFLTELLGANAARRLPHSKTLASLFANAVASSITSRRFGCLARRSLRRGRHRSIHAAIRSDAPRRALHNSALSQSVKVNHQTGDLFSTLPA